ncbi:MAG TPA: ABC transporter permease subunit, partial [Anaerolineae bacterium]|nr:ABC transporter permease subunit [Anaerolineae bacterium]
MVRWQSITDTIQLSKRDLTALALLALILLLPLVWRDPSPLLVEFPASWDLHLRQPLDEFQRWIVRNRLDHPLFVYCFDPLSDVVDVSIRAFEGLLLWLPWPVVVLTAFLLGQGARGLRLALFSAFTVLAIGTVGLWDESMQTLALMGVSVLLALLIGIPLGILSARFDKVETALRPLLDAMQTLPAFVYLIPVLLFFGIARVPSVIATVIYALPPAIRLTNLGLRGVSPAAIEAARAFGSTPRQIL